MAQFEAAVRGIADACRALEMPVVSGNVSFYNETDGRAIPPTPTVGMVGLIEDVEKHVRVAVPRGRRPRRAPRRDARRARRLRVPAHDPRPRRGAVPRGGSRRPRSAWSTCSRRSPSDGLALLRARRLRRRPRRRAGRVRDAGGPRRDDRARFADAPLRAPLRRDDRRARSFRSRPKPRRPSARLRPPAAWRSWGGRTGGDRLRISLAGRSLIDESADELTQTWRGAFRHAIESADLL